MSKTSAFVRTGLLVAIVTAAAGGVPCLAGDMGSSCQASNPNGSTTVQGSESVVVNGRVSNVPLVSTMQAEGLPGPSHPAGTQIPGAVLVPNSVIAAGQSSPALRSEE